MLRDTNEIDNDYAPMLGLEIVELWEDHKSLTPNLYF